MCVSYAHNLTSRPRSQQCGLYAVHTEARALTLRLTTYPSYSLNSRIPRVQTPELEP